MIKDNHTMSIYNMIEHKIPIFPFEYPLKQELKPEFENTFTHYYMFSEIAYHFPKEFQQRLHAMLLMKSGYYNKLFDASCLKFDPLLTKCLSENGVTDTSKLNIRDYASVKRQVNELLDEVRSIRDENGKQNTEEIGETTGQKDTTTDDHLTRDTDETKLMDRNTDTIENMTRDTEVNEDKTVDGTLKKTVDGTLESTVDGTKDTNSTTGVTTKGNSDKTGTLKEDSTSSSIDRYSDTPQNNLGQMSPSVENMNTMYLTDLRYISGTGTNNATTTEKINSTEQKDTEFTEGVNTTDTTDTTTKEETDQTTKDTSKMKQTEGVEQETTGNEKVKQTEDNHEDIDQQNDTIYHEETEGTHHFVNDTKHKNTTQENTEQKQNTSADSKVSGDEKEKTDFKQKDNMEIKGFEGTSLSLLVTQYYESVRNVLEEFVLEFENLFMGVL